MTGSLDNHGQNGKAIKERKVKMFCKNCGAECSDNALQCPKCGEPMRADKSRVVYILLAFFLGGLGIHDFYIGRIGRGIAYLIVTFALGWLIVPLFFIPIFIILEMIFTTTDAKGNRLS